MLYAEHFYPSRPRLRYQVVIALEIIVATDSIACTAQNGRLQDQIIVGVTAQVQVPLRGDVNGTSLQQVQKRLNLLDGQSVLDLQARSS